MSTIFGNVISARTVEWAVQGTLQYWLETYLRDREISLGKEEGFYARPRSYKIVNAWDDKNPEHATPFIAIVSDGLVDEPLQDGEGGLRAEWRINVGIVVEASTIEDAEFIVKDVYLPVIRMILLQKQSLRDWADPDAEPLGMGTQWYDEQYPDVTGDLERSLFAGLQLFSVMVHEVVNRYGGPTSPADPDTQPGSSWEEFESGSVLVEKVDEV